MPEFDIFRSVTVGQFLPGDSFVHRLDPRAKILGAVFLIAAISFTSSYGGNVVLLLTLVTIFAVSGVSLRFALQGLKSAVPMIAFIALLQLFLYGDYFKTDGEVLILWQWGILRVTAGSIQLVVVTLSRLLELILVVSLLTFTTTTTALTHGIELLLKPLSRIGLPSHEIALVFTIALRFVPTLAEELERLMKAQASRGADFSPKGRLRFIQQTKQMIPLLIPLFVGAFKRADELVSAMESRGYMGGKGRTRLSRLAMTQTDYLVILSALVYSIAILSTTFPV